MFIQRQICKKGQARNALQRLEGVKEHENNIDNTIKALTNARHKQ